MCLEKWVCKIEKICDYTKIRKKIMYTLKQLFLICVGRFFLIFIWWKKKGGYMSASARMQFNHDCQQWRRPCMHVINGVGFLEHDACICDFSIFFPFFFFFTFFLCVFNVYKEILPLYLAYRTAINTTLGLQLS